MHVYSRLLCSCELGRESWTMHTHTHTHTAGLVPTHNNSRNEGARRKWSLSLSRPACGSPIISAPGSWLFIQEPNKSMDEFEEQRGHRYHFGALSPILRTLPTLCCMYIQFPLLNIMQTCHVAVIVIPSRNSIRPTSCVIYRRKKNKTNPPQTQTNSK